MISLAFLRENAEAVRAGAALKGESAPIDEILELDGRARTLRTEVESLRAQQKRASAEIHGAPSEEQRRELALVKTAIQTGDAELGVLDGQITDLLLYVPNPPHETVPHGKDEHDNITVRTWGEKTEFDFEPKPHWEVGEKLGVFDFDRATKLSGARFAMLRGCGARLNRALMTFMLDVATQQHGYTEVWPPYLVRREMMVGTAQLPKFGDDAYRIESDDLFLVPTAEVPVTNLYRDEILEAEQLPISHAAYSACFRREAGAAGKDTRGYIRLHQFDKIELVRFVTPESSLDELELLTGHVEKVLQLLGISHRVLLMCTGDMGFAQWKKYDVEAWTPGMKRWLELSSCSVFGEFQARRANIRYRPAPGDKPRFVHTLNGSGLAVGRTLDAVLETYQTAEGDVRIPEVLRQYLSGAELLSQL